MTRARFLGLGLGLALAVIPISVALAHAVLVSAVPPPSGTYTSDDPPQRVTLTFSEEVTPAFSSIHVFNQTGEVVDHGDLKIADTSSTGLTVTLKPLTSGIYTVAWTSVSAVDGHQTTGSYAFGVGVMVAETGGQAAAVAPGSTPASLAAQWLTVTGQVLLIGVFLFRFLVWRPTLNASNVDSLDEALSRQSLWTGWIGLGLVIVGLIMTVIAQGEAVGALSLASFKIWLGTRFGGMLVMRFWLGLGLALSLSDLGLGLKNREERDERRRWEWWVGLILSLAIALTSTLVSHSAALQEGRQLATLVDAAHLLAAGIWVGGLIQLILAIRLVQTLPDEARPVLYQNLILNFSTIAAGSVGVLLVSGIYLATVHVGSWAALFKTTYGLTLIAKSALALPAFAMAALNLLVIKPRLDGETPDSMRMQRRFQRLVLVEAGFALAVVAAAGFLTDFQPGREALPPVEQAQAVFYRSADDLRVTLTLAPALWRQPQHLDVYIVDRNGAPVESAREVSVRFNFLDRALGVDQVTAAPRGHGHYGLVGTLLSSGGLWEVEVVIRRPNAFDTFLTFQLQTTQDGLIHPLNASPDWGGQVADWLTQGGGWLNGGLLLAGALGWVGLALKVAQRKLNFVILLIPGLIAMSAGVLQIASAIRGPETDAPSDPAALTWLAESDAAMGQLKSLQLLRTTHGDSQNGPVLTETMRFQAPNLFDDQVSNGSENLAQGNMYYYRQPGESLWGAVQQVTPFVFPDFNSHKAISARLGQVEQVDGRSAQSVTYLMRYAQAPITFTRWIDVETKLILREYMEAPGHHMLSIYSGYNAPVSIVVPSTSEIGPTPTAVSPQQP